MIRHSSFAGLFFCLALTSGNAVSAQDDDYEIIDPELLQEEDEETATQEPDVRESPGINAPQDETAATIESNQADAAMESDQTGVASEAINAAYTALQNQEYDIAYDLFYELASQDNALAQYELGVLYHRGAGVVKDVLRASRWYERAAELGYAEAQYRLGNMYLMGEGVRQSDTEAAHWLEKAAQQNHGNARSNLANLRRISSAKPREELEKEAASLPPLKVKDKAVAGGKKKKRGFFKRIFSRDDVIEAQPGNPPGNPVMQESIPETQDQTGHSGTEVASVVTDDAPDRAASKTKSKGFFSRWFGRDDKEDRKAPGDMKPSGTDGQETGSPVLTSGTSGQRPAPLGGSSAVSNYELGMAYALGDVLEQDHTKAFEYFARSAQQGYAPAQYRLGVAYANGDGTAKDLTKAVEWYEKSAAQGYASAQRSLALIYLNGLEEIDQNKPLSLAWYSLLAEDGNQMDIHRRDTLLQQLSDTEIRLSQGMTTEILNRLVAEKD